MVSLWPPMLAEAVLGGLAGARRGAGCCARSGRVMAAKRAAGARTATGLRKRFMESVSSGVDWHDWPFYAGMTEVAGGELPGERRSNKESLSGGRHPTAR